MNRRPLKLGVLGAGMIATYSYGVIPNLRHIPDKVQLVAIADPLTRLAREDGEEHRHLRQRGVLPFRRVGVAPDRADAFPAVEQPFGAAGDLRDAVRLIHCSWF